MVFLALLGLLVFLITGIFLWIAQAEVSKLYWFTMEADNPLAHSVHLKENSANIKTLLIALKYGKINWQVIGDLK